MLTISSIIKRCIYVSMVFTIFALFVDEKVAYIKGLAIGAIVAMVMIKLIECQVNEVLEKQTSKIRIIIRHMSRLFLIIGVMFMAGYDSVEMLIGVTLGILSLKIALYSEIFFKN